TATLKKLIRKGTLNFSFVPVLCGSAFKNKGVQPLLDAVIDYLPSPLDIPPVEGLKMDGETTDTRAPSDDAPFSALAFKIMNDPFVGTLTFARIYSGKLETAQQVLNSVKDKKEKVGRMLLMHANDREDIQVAYAGDIVALAGLKDTTTGDTLCAQSSPIILERMEFPDPVISQSVEPKTKADQDQRDPWRAWIGLPVFRRDQGRQRPQGIYSIRREGPARDRGNRFVDRLPDHRLRGAPGRRQVSRRRLVRSRVRNLRPRRDARGGAEGRHQAA